MWGVMEAHQKGFSELVPDPRLLAPGPLLTALACCHSVALLDGQAYGDPLELKMMESTGWVRGAGCIMSRSSIISLQNSLTQFALDALD
jgi:hypothetical protein